MKYSPSSMKKGFTLIELLVVISIIAFISTIVLASVSVARAKARDSFRIQSLKELQKAVELYHQEYGSYPSSGNVWRGGGAGCAGAYGYGATGYIPGIVPNYISVLPEDPRSSSVPLKCFMYRSNGTDYMIMAYRGAESFDARTTIWAQPDPAEPLREFNITIYTPGVPSMSPHW